jgi:hypothetical protein
MLTLELNWILLLTVNLDNLNETLTTTRYVGLKSAGIKISSASFTLYFQLTSLQLFLVQGKAVVT